MPEIILHLPDGNLLHLPEGTSPETMVSAVRQYGDQQAASAQDRSSFGSSIKDTASRAVGAAAGELNPMTIGTNLLHSVFHPVDTVTGLASAAGNAIAHPIDTLSSLSDPETGGKAIGDLALMFLAGRVPQAVGALPDGLKVTGAKAARALLEPKKAALGKLNEIIDSAAPAASTPSSVANVAAPTSAGIGNLSADDVAAMRASGYPEHVIQRAAGVEGGPVAAPKPAMSSPSGLKPEGYYDKRLRPPSIDALSSEPESAPTPQSVRRPSTAEQDNIDSHSSYGEGHVLPEALPTELRDAANDGLNFPSRGTYNLETGKLESPSLNGLSKDIQPFSEFSDAVDPIINSAGPDDASSTHEGLGRSRLTNSWKDWIQSRGQSTPGWPFKEIQQ